MWTPWPQLCIYKLDKTSFMSASSSVFPEIFPDNDGYAVYTVIPLPKLSSWNTSTGRCFSWKPELPVPQGEPTLSSVQELHLCVSVTLGRFHRHTERLECESFKDSVPGGPCGHSLEKQHGAEWVHRLSGRRQSSAAAVAVQSGSGFTMSKYLCASVLTKLQKVLFFLKHIRQIARQWHHFCYKGQLWPKKNTVHCSSTLFENVLKQLPPQEPIFPNLATFKTFKLSSACEQI